MRQIERKLIVNAMGLTNVNNTTFKKKMQVNLQNNIDFDS